MKKPKQYKPTKAKNVKQFKSKSSKRESVTAKGYDRHWSKYRFRFLYYNPKCYCCGQPSSVVDHIYTARAYPEMFEKLDNHCPLCASCHSTITQLFEKKGEPDIQGKIRYMENIRKQSNTTSRIKVLPYYSKKF